MRMKKLLTLSAAVLLSAAGPLLLVACKKSGESSGAVIDLPGIVGKDIDGFSNLQTLTISQLFQKFIERPQLRKELFSEVTKRIQLAVVKNDKYFAKDKERMEAQLKNYMEGSLKISLGADWAKKIKEQEDKFGGPEGYKDSILLNPESPVNVYNILKERFLDTFQFDYVRTPLADVREYANALVQYLAKPNSDMNNWWNGDIKDTANINRILRRAYEFKDNEALKLGIKEAFVNINPIQRDNLILLNENGKATLSTNQPILNKLSVNQRFLAQKWYNDKKPLSISEFSFEYNGEKKDGVNNGVTSENFNSDSTTKIAEVLADINAGIMSFEKIVGKHFPTLANFGEKPKLLTLDSPASDFSPLSQAAAYNLAINPISNVAATPADLNGLLPIIQRNPDGNGKIVFQKLTIGANINDPNKVSDKTNIVVIADTDRIRFIKINGGGDINNINLATNNGAATGQTKDSNGIEEAITSDKNMLLAQTPYLQYLFDTYQKRIEDKDKNESFNPLAEVINYATFNAANIEKNENWWSWFWKTMTWIKGDPNWWNNGKLIDFGSGNSLLNVDVLAKAIAVFGNSPNSLILNTFIETLNGENIKINDLKSGETTSTNVSGLINVDFYTTSFQNSASTLWAIPTTPALTKPNLEKINPLEIKNYWLKGDNN